MTPCTEKEVAAFRAYQWARSDTASFVVALLDRVTLHRTCVIGVSDIGRLCSFCKNIGDAHAIDHVGTERFSVAAAVQLLEDARFRHNSGVADAKPKVLEYLTRLGQRESSPWVTLVHFRDGVVVLDGNKTCLAAFMPARRVPDYALPAYCLEESTMTVRQALGYRPYVRKFSGIGAAGRIAAGVRSRDSCAAAPTQRSHVSRAQARAPRGDGGPRAFVSPRNGRSTAYRPAEPSRDRMPAAV